LSSVFELTSRVRSSTEWWFSHDARLSADEPFTSIILSAQVVDKAQQGRTAGQQEGRPTGGQANRRAGQQEGRA